jgi:hypothetical protein
VSVFLILFLVHFNNAVGQKPLPKVQPSARRDPSLSNLDDDLKAEQRKIAVMRAQSVADQLLKFNNEKIRAVSVARLGDILWKDDETFARNLFLKAMDLSGAANLNYERRTILKLLARRDPKLAKRFLDEDLSKKAHGFGAAQVNAEIAQDLALSDDDPATAINFARRSVESGISPWMGGVLKQLRRKDPKSADELFLSMLAKAASEPSVDADTFIQLASYIFTSPKIDPADDMRLLQTVVGRVMIIDITADRQNIPPALVRSYLEVATNLLSRPIPDQHQKELYYALGYLLLPKTVRFAPELTAAMTNALQALAPGVPPQMTQESAYANLYSPKPKELDESLDDIEKREPKYRDASYLGWVYSLCLKNDFKQARFVNGKISDTDLKVQLTTLIDFTEGARLLEKDQSAVSNAEAIAKRLPQGIERAVLYLGIAHARAENGDQQRAIEAITEAVKAAHNLYEARSSFLILNASRQMVPLDVMRAQQLLKEAIQDFNAQDSNLLSRVEWRQRVDAKPVWRHFPLEIKGVTFGLDENLAMSVKSDVEFTSATVGRLTDEGIRASALLAMVGASLKQE